MNIRQLKNALLDGEFELEHAQPFYARRDADDCLMSPTKSFLCGQKCRPVRLAKNALLVSVAEGNEVWFSWVHADDTIRIKSKSLHAT